MNWSKKQDLAAKSNVEAEFRIIAYGVYELLWLKIILGDLRIRWVGSMKLFCSNKSVVDIAYNLMQHDKTSHIEIDILHKGKVGWMDLYLPIY